MTLIAMVALAMVAFRIYRQQSEDWAYDRRAAAEHRHEARFCLDMLLGIRSYRDQHPSDTDKNWVIHGVSYQVTPELENYLIDMVHYHQYQAARHEFAIGRWWIYVTPEPPPPAPPVVPPDEAMGR